MFAVGHRPDVRRNRFSMIFAGLRTPCCESAVLPSRGVCDLTFDATEAE
jgi:hypothetical protein